MKVRIDMNLNGSGSHRDSGLRIKDGNTITKTMKRVWFQIIRPSTGQVQVCNEFYILGFPYKKVVQLMDRRLAKVLMPNS